MSSARKGFLDVLSSIKIDNLTKNFPRLVQCARNTGRKIFCFPNSLQNSETSSCGAFVLVIGYLISRCQTPSDILNEFFGNNIDDESLRFYNDMKACISAKILFHLPQSLFDLLYDIDFITKLKKNEKITQNK